MRPVQKIAAVILVALLGATAYGLFRTGRPAPASGNGNGNHAAGTKTPLVDQSSLRTAQKLAEFADKPEEQILSKEAIRLTDHELDLAFASAKREAEAHPPVLSPEAKEIQARLEKAQDLQKADQALAAQLTTQEAKASGRQKEALGDRLDEVKEQLELVEDEVDDATMDLNRAGGDA